MVVLVCVAVHDSMLLGKMQQVPVNVMHIYTRFCRRTALVAS